MTSGKRLFLTITYCKRLLLIKKSICKKKRHRKRRFLKNDVCFWQLLMKNEYYLLKIAICKQKRRRKCLFLKEKVLFWLVYVIKTSFSDHIYNFYISIQKGPKLRKSIGPFTIPDRNFTLIVIKQSKFAFEQ